jgi:hypothetical protein
MHTVRIWSLALATASVAISSQISFAQNPRAQRAEARNDRQEARQTQRLGNRGQYYNQQTWTQLDPWIARNQVPPVQRAARAANAAANVTERALNTGANVAATNANAAAAANANARYGFTNPNVATTPQGWFYDYYTYSPTYYSAPAGGAKTYGNASRYYDLNNDGVYDSLSTFRDSDSNGSYDVYDRFDFAENDNDKNNDGIADGPNDANRHTVNGTVDATKVAKVNGVESLVVRVTTGGNANDQATIVDLGSVERWPNDSVRQGDPISATGPLEQIGDKRVLMAEAATIGNQREVVISRTSPRIEGQVVDVTSAQVKGADHTMAIVESSSGRQIVDLGPADRLKFKLEPQMKISVQGVPVQFRNHSVVLADQVDLNGQQVTIQRW